MADDDCCHLPELQELESTAVDVEPPADAEADAADAAEADDDLDVCRRPDTSRRCRGRTCCRPVASPAGAHRRPGSGAGARWAHRLARVSAPTSHSSWSGSGRLFSQVGRQGAINLTTLDYEHIDADVNGSSTPATGTFYDDFQQRAPSFTDVVKQVKSKSVGTVTEAALESVTATEAEVLVAVTVKSAIVGQPEQQPRAWRMRILVQKVGDDAKVFERGVRVVTDSEDKTSKTRQSIDDLDDTQRSRPPSTTAEGTDDVDESSAVGADGAEPSRARRLDQGRRPTACCLPWR